MSAKSSPLLEPVKEVALVPAQSSTPAVVEQPDWASMFERLATNPAVDVDKLEKLIGMQERLLAANAKAEFDAAFSQMQGDIPVISEKGEILVEGKLRSRFARNEDIQEAVRPILQRYGFALRFRNEGAPDGKLKVIGILSHRSGHSEQDEFVTSADKSGSKNDIQAIGSARSYGQRYTTISLLNIATRGEDDDAKKAGRLGKPDAPDGFENWWTDLTATVANGSAALERAWRDSPKPLKEYAANQRRSEWADMKRKAEQVPAS